MKRVKRINLILMFFILILFVNQAFASIVLKVLVANPSKEQEQRVPVMVYLPKEAKPEDVLERSDLEIAYDTQQGSYYVYGEYRLKPGEVVEKEIELSDIWVISNTEIESLRLEAVKLFGLLKNTEFAERVDFLSNSIEAKLNQIIEKQKDSPVNPERHISDYRDNLKIIESVKSDLALARSLLAQSKPFSVVLIWRLIIIIIIFLGVLGGSFYLIWQRQIKIINEEVPPVEKEEEEDATTVSAEEDKEKEKAETDNIEKIIKNEEEE